MNAIIVPKPVESKQFGNAIEPSLTDSMNTAGGGLPKDGGTSDREFDVQVALDRVEGNRELLQNMVGVFSMQWRERLAEIAAAASRRNGAALELVANRLKLSLRSIGAGKASRLAQELEELGRESACHDLDNKHARLGIEIERLVNALNAFSRETVAGIDRSLDRDVDAT
jgi:HPt (histidine-containing phosphotransfer) domain-containing protein